MAKDWEHLGLRPHLSKKERLPKSYKEVEKVLKDVKACKGNLKTVLNNSRLRGSMFKKVYALAANVLKNRLILDRIIQETELLKKETFFREDLAEILIYELVLGKGLPGESRPVVILKQYEDSIHKAYEVAMKDENLNVKGLQSLPRYVRVNTLLTTVTDVLKNLRKAGYREIYYGENTSEKEYLDLIRNLETGNFLIDYHFKDLLVFEGTENLTTWSLYQKHHVYIQDKTSYIPVYALDPKPGSVIIDACAAPGMKTIHMAAAMENNGKIYAYEKSDNRFLILKEMIDHATVQICEAECADFYLVNANDPKFHDLECILVDPSCSGSGMVNRMDTVTDTDNSKNTLRLQKLAGFQILLLKHALSFPSVKRVVYSTCSISEEENEYVVHEVLNHFCHIFKLASVMPDWPIRGSENFEFGKLCLRAYPEETLTNGFFVAMFERLSYDEMLNATRPFSEKLSKTRKKRKENLDGRNSINNVNYINSKQQDNSQFLNDNSTPGSRNSPKKKKEKGCIGENCFSQDYADNKEDNVQFENKVKKKKHLVETDDKFKFMTVSHRLGNESNLNFSKNNTNISSVTNQNKISKVKKNEMEDGDNSNVVVLCKNSVTYTKTVDFTNADSNRNSDFSFDRYLINQGKKKHKNEVSNCDVDIDNYKKSDTGEQNIVKNELDERESKIRTKKHKHKKKHSRKEVEVHNNIEYITKNSLPETESISELKGTISRKKHKKHKKNISNCDVDEEDYKKSDTVEQNILENELEEKELKITAKKHKHKKHSKKKVEVHDDVEYITENSVPESEMNFELKDAGSRKKHKKHGKKNLEAADLSPEMSHDSIIVHKNSFCYEEVPTSTSVHHKKRKRSISEKIDVLDSYDEKLSKTGQNIEENCLKKKHKKKCKDKKTKEE